MSQIPKRSSHGDCTKTLSRRRALERMAAIAAGAGAGWSVLVAPARAAGTVPKSAVAYQDKPKGDQECSNCIQFVPGATPEANGTCKVVAGDVSPHGWCMVYAPGK